MIETLDRLNKAIIVLNIFSAIIFTATMGYFSHGQATISWQLYQYGLIHPEFPLIMGGLIFRWITKIELGVYDDDR